MVLELYHDQQQRMVDLTERGPQDFTEEIGATRMVLGSHLWPRHRVAGAEEAVGAVMPQGSVTPRGGPWVPALGLHRFRLCAIAVSPSS